MLIFDCVFSSASFFTLLQAIFGTHLFQKRTLNLRKSCCSEEFSKKFPGIFLENVQSAKVFFNGKLFEDPNLYIALL